MLEDLSDTGRAAWREAMTELARRPNVVAKLSGFGTFIHRCDPAHIALLTTETVAIFGADRCLWGSNFPIEKLWTDYATLFETHRQAAGGLSQAEQQAGASVMMLANQMNKGRMSDAANLKRRITWQLLWLSTGEHAMSHYMEAANLKPDPGMEVRQLDIPANAGLRSGKGQPVFVARGEGKFEPRPVKSGVTDDNGYIHILSGLSEGEAVVVSAQFMLDSESTLREALQKMTAPAGTAGAEGRKTVNAEAPGVPARNDGAEPLDDLFK